MEVVGLNDALSRCGGGEIIVTEILCLDQTERGAEYTVICSDGEERIMLQHICGNGITWLWDENYDEFMEQLNWM